MTCSSVFLYGPPGSGKSTLGMLLAQALDVSFYDLDALIEQHSRGMSIPHIFATEGETGFRQRERKELQHVLEGSGGVIALGGGTLLDPHNRSLLEAHAPILLVSASCEVLFNRLQTAPNQRPLLAEGTPAALSALLERRADHYASFPLQLDTTLLTPEQALWQAQMCLGIFRVKGMQSRYHAYDVLVRPGILDKVGSLLHQQEFKGPVLIVSDENTAPLYAERVVKSVELSGFSTSVTILQAGEEHKNIETLVCLWDAMLAAGLERSSTLVALGGGVVSDLAGFAASTYLRGLPWVALPTTLLAMADASLGGKTAVDLPRGKNLVGAFHPPRLVLADPNTLTTLPAAELRSGLAEVVKHGVISDPQLFAMCAAFGKMKDPTSQVAALEIIVKRAVAVKVGVIELDPYEHNQRAVLNLGHTIGHAIESASGFHLRHGEAVSIGMVAEALIAEQMGIAEAGLAETLADMLHHLGLPTTIPADLDRQAVLAAIGVDKKRNNGKVLFALPVKIGEVSYGIEVDDQRRNNALDFSTARS
jgi:shikimate kinase/3-dehydroquinate synthase